MKLSITWKIFCVKANPESWLPWIGPPKLATPVITMAGPVPASDPGHASLLARGVLHAQFVQQVAPERRDELRREGVLRVG